MRTRSSTTKRLLKLVTGISAMTALAVPAAFAANTEFLPAFSVETLTPASQAALAWKNVAPNALAGYYTYMPLTAADAALAGFPAAAGCAVSSDCYIITAKKLVQPMSLEFLKFPAVMPDLVGLGSPNLFPGPGLIQADGATPFVDSSTLGSTLASAGSMTVAWGYGSGGAGWQPFGPTGPTLSRGNAPVVFQNTPIGLTTFTTAGANPELDSAGNPVKGIWHFPAPTIKGTSGRPVNVLWMHQVPNEKPLGLDPSVDCGTVAHGCYPYNRIVLHVHGAHVGPESDGLATSWFSPVYPILAGGPLGGRLNGEDAFTGTNIWDGYKYKVQPVAGVPAEYVGLPIYHYPMTQPAGTIWYHDHAIGATHLNTEMGMAGFFPVTDSVEFALQQSIPANNATNPPTPAQLPILPTGNPTFSTYDVGLALQDRHFDVNGQQAFPAIGLYDKNDPNCVFDADNNAIPGTCTRLHWMKKINPASATDPQPAVHFVPYPATPALVAAAPELNGTDAASTALNFPAGPIDPITGLAGKCQVNLTNTLEGVAGVDPVTGTRIPFTQCAPFPATSATLEYFGNMPVVNGVTYPVYDVDPTVYRFRIIGGTDSRTWIAQLVKGATQPTMANCGGYDAVNDVYGAPNGCAVYPAPSIVPFYQVGSEQGLLTNMVKRNELDIMGGERIDVLVDFTGLNGQTITMKNLGDDAPFSGRFDFDDIKLRQPTSVLIPEIMKFRVGKTNVAASAQTPVHGKALPGVLYDSSLIDPVTGKYVTYPNITPTITRTIALIEITDQYGRTMPTIDARGYVPPGIRTTEIMQQNVPEYWDIINTTVDAHPMHIHQVAMQAIYRQAVDPVAGFRAAFNNGLNYFGVEDTSAAFREVNVFTPSQYVPGGAAIPVAAYDNGLKDTIQIPPGYLVRAKIVFDVLGDYVWHCHILSHEEHDMMRPYRITNAAVMPAPAAFTVSPVNNAVTTVTLAPAVGTVPANSQYVVQYRKVGAPFWETNGQKTATQTVNLDATGLGTYEFRAQIIEPAIQEARVLTRPDSTWTAGTNTAFYEGVRITTPAALPNYTLGTGSYASITLAATGGVAPYTWAVKAGSTLPSGLALSTAGVITGTPNVIGNYSFVITATDFPDLVSPTPIVAEQTFTLSVSAFTALNITTTSPLAPATVNTPATVTFAAQGGVGAYTWTLLGSQIPPIGMTLAANGVLSGTPTVVGTYQFQVQVADAAVPPAVASRIYTMDVNLPAVPPVVTAPANATATASVPMTSVTFTASGANAKTWALSAGTTAVPAGLAINNSGVLSGTVTTVGTYNITVTATDTVTTLSGSAPYTVTVNPGVAAITSPTNNTRIAGTSQLFTWTDSGADLYQLLVGASVGSSSYYASPGLTTTTTSHTATGLPSNGSTIYVRLYSKRAGVWSFNDYTYTSGNPAPAVMTTPAANNAVLVGPNQTFTWSNAGADLYQLLIGTSVGNSSLYASPGLTTTTTNVVGLPANNSLIYVRIYSKHNGVWSFNDYTYTSAP